MNLALCSLGITHPEALQTLFDKPLSKIKCGVIKNPMDLKSDEKKELLYNLVDQSFKDVGINKQDIDLKKYIGKTDELSKIINKLDMLWVTGGNVFYLRWLLAKVEIESVLYDAIKHGLVYGGDSAGALIICPTLKYLDMVDDTSEIEEVIYEGLGLIDFVPLPHWGDEKFQPMLTEVKNKLENDGYKVTTFGNTQMILVKGSKVSVVGE